MLDLDEIQSFVSVATCGGFRRAAEVLGRTQSTVSHHVVRLEQRLGRRLFVRTTRSVRLTDEGEQLLADAQRLLDAEASLRERLTSQPLQGRVTFGASEEVASTRLPPVFASFARTYPGVSLEVRVGTSVGLIRACDEGELDLAVIKRPPGSTKGEALWQDALLWVAADRYRVNDQVPLPLAVYQQEESISRKAILTAMRTARRDFRIAYTSYSLVGVRAAVIAGFAITALPESALCPGLRILGEAERLPPLAGLTYVVVRRARRSHGGAVDLLHDALLQLRT
ncbi:LysR substrate-binding domain-containing protein [Burkholderia alba]|uniref:LysR substrate-binding domain-containing protein n=1 Tax=Burkholderia alba TaxID=2683677 RepID=UPI002B059A8C|nr:LysR substrate-binding domain-containing protein [Burkholderia alba]